MIYRLRTSMLIWALVPVEVEVNPRGALMPDAHVSQADSVLSDSLTASSADFLVQ